jgi:SPP1 gp7 family putative phage head morphogenesis protein
MRPVKLSLSQEVRYRNQLLELSKQLQNGVNNNITPLLRQFESAYVNDAYANIISEAFDRLRKQYVDINEDAQIVANSFVNNTDQVNKTRFYSSMENVVGINLQSVIQNEGLEDILVATTSENVSLIRSIPEEYFKRIEGIVFSGTTQGSTAGSMIQQIKKSGKVTDNRARLIARDQSSKLNSALTQQRAQNLGAEEYIWRTSEDERVRESHRSKNGRVYRWDNPPNDTGNPGHDIQCRCVAQPIIKV